MSHFDIRANQWDTPEKIEATSRLANNIKNKLTLSDELDILDFGCGTGLLGLEFLDRCKSLVGVDSSNGMLEVFRNKVSENKKIEPLFINLENDNLDRTFDLIISAMTFHHLNNPESVLMKLKPMLNPGGQIAIVDLMSEDGSFHPDNEGMGVKHFGFSKDEFDKWAIDLKMKCNYSNINVIHKNDRDYPQFLAILN